MKKILAIGFLIALASIFITFILPKTDDEQVKQVAKSVMDNVIAKNYDQASELMFYFDGGTNEEPTITQEEGKRRWLKRIKDFDQSGVSLVGYEKLRVEMYDSVPISYVDLILNNNGKEEVRQDVYIVFIKEGGEWKVHYFEDVNGSDDWELALSGYVPFE
ncbi:hypothetical protein [Planococcus shixiaomingii]|uniref:hypothetical protein n=1 Tax=Planococcus shixiaomingii TaxID=3058393 RepID=UPI00261966D6|nr:hypothetical protein [Planococcus sp. N022]WKA56553.1 hypothetical protein QWY21_09455 [Planococcus sp. N022]